MSVQVQLRRDTAANISGVAGAPGELWVDTSSFRLRVNDGVTNSGWCPLGASPATVVEAVDTTRTSPVRHGGTVQFACQEQLLSSLSGATVATTIQIPNAAIVLGVSVRVITAVTGAASFRVDATTTRNGDAGTTNGQFGKQLSVSAGSTNVGVIGPTAWYAPSTITLSGWDSGDTTNVNFTGGAVRVQINYILINPPAS
jgi:Major tropism determinant N-terminal domain